MSESEWNSVTRRIAPPWLVPVTSILAIVAIFGIDLADGSSIWTHVLYVFPICAIALSCARFTWVVVALLLSAVFQLVTLLGYDITVLAVIANLVITLVANVMTVGLARAARSRLAKLKTLATTDVLTGLHNRLGFQSVAENEITRQKRYGGVFSLAVLDLDRFKVLNDSIGHAGGDLALRRLSDILRASLRRSDSIARLGGDEFVILMPNTQETDCAALCHQLSATIAGQMEAAGFPITASIGYATFERPADSFEAALQKADDAMYAAKVESPSSIGTRRKVPAGLKAGSTSMIEILRQA